MSHFPFDEYNYFAIRSREMNYRLKIQFLNDHNVKRTKAFFYIDGEPPSRHQVQLKRSELLRSILSRQQWKPIPDSKQILKAQMDNSSSGKAGNVNLGNKKLFFQVKFEVFPSF